MRHIRHTAEIYTDHAHSSSERCASQLGEMCTPPTCLRKAKPEESCNQEGCFLVVGSGSARNGEAGGEYCDVYGKNAMFGILALGSSPRSTN